MVEEQETLYNYVTGQALEDYWTKAKKRGREYLDRRFAKKRGITIWGDNPYRPSPSLMCALPLLKHVRAKSVLEVGCGEGRDAVRLALDGHEVAACDFSRAGVERGRTLATRHNVEVDFRFQDFLADPPMQGAFDAVCALKFLHQLRRSEVPDFLARASECLRPGGILLLSTFAAVWDHNYGRPNPGAEHDVSRWIEEDVWQCRPDRPIVYWRDVDLVATLERAGFTADVPSLVCYPEDNHPEEGEEAGGQHDHALWFAVGKRHAVSGQVP